MINILNEIDNEPGSNAKVKILSKYKDNNLLKEILYKTYSNKIKFYIKKIPTYNNINLTPENGGYTLGQLITKLDVFTNRELTGNSAIDYLTKLLSKTTLENGLILERVIQKDLKIGMGRTNINKVFPKLIEKTPYMGAKSYSEKLVRKILNESSLYKKEISNSPLVISQIKMDGRYCNVIIQNGEVELVSRQGETTHIGSSKLLVELSNLNDNIVLNGELTIDGVDRYTANGIIASIVDIEGKRKTRGEVVTEKKIVAFEKKHGVYNEFLNKIRFTVWDLITIDEYFLNKSNTLYLYRLDRLNKLLNNNESSLISVIEGKFVDSFEGAMDHFTEALDRGLEGTILKAVDKGWKDGKPNWQVKMKLEMNIDLKIIGFNYGNKGTKNENVISTLITESSCGLLKTNPSGMDEEMMKYVTEHQEELLGTIVEIRCCGISQNSKGDYSTLHPSVVKLRDDKDTFDSLEDTIRIEKMVKNLI